MGVVLFLVFCSKGVEGRKSKRGSNTFARTLTPSIVWITTQVSRHRHVLRPSRGSVFLFLHNATKIFIAYKKFVGFIPYIYDIYISLLYQIML